MNNLSKNDGPPMPRGQMPIEEVFKMMWARMNYLENAVKQIETNNKKEDKSNQGATTISQLKNENEIINTPSQNQPPQYEKIDVSEIQELITSQDERITQLSQELLLIKNELSNRSTHVDRAIQEIGADLTDMNTKYTQMNNFLVEIQTTQITVNNQILRHYNENCSDSVESLIEKNASEKFMKKNSQENINEETVSQADESQQSTTDVDSVNTSENNISETVVETKTNEPQLESVSDVKQSGNTIQFNIE